MRRGGIHKTVWKRKYIARINCVLGVLCKRHFDLPLAKRTILPLSTNNPITESSE